MEFCLCCNGLMYGLCRYVCCNLVHGYVMWVKLFATLELSGGFEHVN